MSDDRRRELVEQIIMLDSLSQHNEGTARVAYDMCSIDELRQFRDSLLLSGLTGMSTDAKTLDPQEVRRQVAIAHFGEFTPVCGRA